MGNMILANNAKTVDDVLASIRKLVSDETRARSLEAEKKAIDETSAETLMLTPELKVLEDRPLVLDVPAKELKVVTSDASPDQIELDEEKSVHTAPFQDEVALRELVGEMIREELQGELGNRITRNVRKLVRQEIENAMKSMSQLVECPLYGRRIS